MGGLLSLVVTNLPTIISVAGDINAIFNVLKDGESLYEAVTAKHPMVAKVVDAIASNAEKLLPPQMQADIAKLTNKHDGILKAMFIDHSWEPATISGYAADGSLTQIPNPDAQ